jgi:hypothetical protein
MSTGLVLVLVVVAAYLAGRVAFDWLARRFLIVSGAEYLLLGILLGPQVSGMVDIRMVQSFAPLILLALGWMGAIIGVQLHLPTLVSTPGPVFRIALRETLITFTLVSAVEAGALAFLLGYSLPDALPPAIAMGAVATATASAGIELSARFLGNRGPIVSLLSTSATVSAFVAVLAMGLLLSVDHGISVGPSRPPTATEWAVITVAIGVIGGVLFHLFLGAERHVDRMFISLAGGVILVSGAAAYLGLSPILSAMFFGAILVNTSRSHEEITAALMRLDRPLYFVLLIFAGVTWTPSTRAWILPVLVFLIGRATFRVGAARLSTRIEGLLPVFGTRWGFALLGQGGLAIALALNYLYHDGSKLPNMVFTAAVASVLLTDLLSARLARSVIESESR